MAYNHGYWTSNYSVAGASSEINGRLQDLERAYDNTCKNLNTNLYKRTANNDARQRLIAEDKSRLYSVIDQIDICINDFQKEIQKCDALLEIIPQVGSKISDVSSQVRSGLQIICENFIIDDFTPGQENGKEIEPALARAEDKNNELNSLINSKKEELNQGIQKASKLKDAVENKIRSIG